MGVCRVDRVREPRPRPDRGAGDRGPWRPGGAPNADIIFKLKKLGGFDLSKNVEEELLGGLIRDVEPRGMKMRLVRYFKNWAYFPDRVIDWYPFLMHEAMRQLARPPIRCHLY